MKNKMGVTLIEMVVVTALMSLILIPVYRVLSHGSKSAIEGVNRSGVVLEGQQILGQIKDDLSASYFIHKDGEKHNIHNIFKQKSIPGEIKYSIITFNGGKESQKVISTTAGGISYRRLNRVEYRLISHKGSPYKTLERTIRLHPQNNSFGGSKTMTKVLSNKVNFFEITTADITSCGESREFFRISLLMFDKKEGIGNKSLVDGTGKIDSSKVFIADFSATVSPVILNTILDNVGMNRNWYTDPEVPAAFF